MHLKQNDITILKDAFNRKYERELIGTKMGQFHSDFNSSKMNNCNIYAKKSIFLGKKCYIDVLGNDKNDVIDYHIWLKGVPSDSIYAKCVELNKTPYDLYNMLLNGEPITFDLCKNKKNEMSSWLKWIRLFEYETISDFKRCVKF